MHKTSPLVTLLGLVFSKGNYITEDSLGVAEYNGWKFGAETFHLNGSHEDHYHWFSAATVPGVPSRACTETSKMRVMEMLAKVNGTVLHYLPILVWRGIERWGREGPSRAAARASTPAITGARSGVLSSCHVYPHWGLRQIPGVWSGHSVVWVVESG